MPSNRGRIESLSVSEDTPEAARVANLDIPVTMQCKRFRTYWQVDHD